MQTMLNMMEPNTYSDTNLKALALLGKTKVTKQALCENFECIIGMNTSDPVTAYWHIVRACSKFVARIKLARGRLARGVVLRPRREQEVINDFVRQYGK